MHAFGYMRAGQTYLPPADFEETPGGFELARWFKANLKDGDLGFVALTPTSPQETSVSTTFCGPVDSETDMRSFQDFLVNQHLGLLKLQGVLTQKGMPKIMTNPYWTGKKLVCIDTGAPIRSWEERDAESVVKPVAKAKVA